MKNYLLAIVIVFALSPTANAADPNFGDLINTMKGIAEQAKKQKHSQQQTDQSQQVQPTQDSDQAQQQAQQAEQARQQAEQAKREAEQAKAEAERAKQEALLAKQQAEQAKLDAANAQHHTPEPAAPVAQEPAPAPEPAAPVAQEPAPAPEPAAPVAQEPAPVPEPTTSDSSASSFDSSFILRVVAVVLFAVGIFFGVSKKGAVNMDKREAIAKYFAPFPKWAIWFIVVGVLMLAGNGGVIVGGIVVAAIGGWAIFNWSQQPNDAQVDAFIEEDMKTVISKSLGKSGIDESELVSESVVIRGPRFWDLAGAEWHWKKGKDNNARFTPINTTVVHMTQNQLITYQCALDLLTGNALNESTDEYFYKDVVSVSTKTISKTVTDAKNVAVQLNSAETFALTTAGGTSVEVILKDPKLIEMMGGANIPTTYAEQAIQSIRKMLRDKKQ